MSPNFRIALGAALALALLFCVGQAFAGTANLTWTAPTTRTDGSALSGAVTYKVYRGTSAAAVASATTPIGTATSPAYTDTSAPAGTQFYAVAAVDAAGLESAKTNAVSVVIPVAPPSPPTGLTVVAVVAGLNMNPVYRINADGTRGTAVLGFVPVGTVCTGASVYTYRSRSYHRVDPASVKWEKTAPTANAAAACG